jgi:uncharacterized membrane protein YkvA (DUF1232 family)
MAFIDYHGSVHSSGCKAATTRRFYLMFQDAPQPRPRIHRCHSIIQPGFPGVRIDLGEYLQTHSGKITAAFLADLRHRVGEIHEKLDSEQAWEHFDLQENGRKLLTVIESERAQQTPDPLPQDLAEAGLALSYLLEVGDLIPDSIPVIGLTDDARLLACVMDRNPSLRDGGR